MTRPADKFQILVIELKSLDYPRSLKLEIRKGVKMMKTERAIAYSRHSSVQVYVRTIPLREMMMSKIDAFLQRKEIRDAYDLEFLVKKGVEIDIPPEKADQVLTAIAALTRQDYNVKLSSLLETDQRLYYRRFGSAISAVGDLDDDGKPELAVGAPMADSDPNDLSGKVYLFQGKDIGPATTLADARSLNGMVKNQAYGTALAAGRKGRLLIGAPGSTGGTGGVALVDALAGDAVTGGSSGGNEGAGDDCH